MKARFFSHWLYSQDLPNQLHPEALQHLVERLCSGDESVVEDIAKAHLRLVLRIAARYRRHGAYDDLVSAGIERMLECIPRFAQARANWVGPDHGITPYIVSNVRSGVTSYIENDSVVKVPGRTLRHKGVASPIKFTAIEPDAEVNRKAPKRPASGLEVCEVLEMSCESDLDRKIVKLRVEGHNDYDIARATGYPQTTVYRARAAIEQRFDALWRK